MIRVLAVSVLLAVAWAECRAAGIIAESLPDLPSPVSNNAVALLETDGGPVLFSFLGLGPGKGHEDIHARAWRLEPDAETWAPLPELPVERGRLAGVAATAGQDVWLFGGYTVAADGTEASTPEVFHWRDSEWRWLRAPDMPVPVDDATAFVYQDRYIYLLSGWHDRGNVNLVQVLDTQTLEWHQATPYPGHPVFGHAGGMAGRRMAVCGGVRIEYAVDGAARAFQPSDQCWLGEVSAGDFRRIAWRPLPAYPGAPRYRAAATADGPGQLTIAGGSSNPYNYDGIGYNGKPSVPETAVLGLGLETLEWRNFGELPAASMDHRGLLFSDGWYYLAGGMLDTQRVTDRVIRFRLDGR